MSIKKEWYCAGIVILLFALGASFLLRNSLSAKEGAWRNSLPVKGDAWQAVFLTNNQVYFGKLSDTKGDYIELTQVFYLQSDQSLNDKQKDTSNLNLIKLGAEIHGPEDAMYIAKKQIIFWENLKSDSKIVKIISGYK